MTWSATRARPLWPSAWAATQSYSLAVMTHLQAPPHRISMLHAVRQHWPQHGFMSHLALSIAFSKSARSLCASQSVPLLLLRHEEHSGLIGFVTATGQTKDETPIALRLRSRDAVIMAGPARMCYHGIPRVLKEAGAADGRSAASGGAGDGDEGCAAMAEHMRDTRINISIRASR